MIRAAIIVNVTGIKGALSPTAVVRLVDASMLGPGHLKKNGCVLRTFKAPEHDAATSSSTQTRQQCSNGSAFAAQLLEDLVERLAKQRP